MVGGERCELDAAHPVVDLTTADGAAALADEIWSAPRFAAGKPRGNYVFMQRCYSRALRRRGVLEGDHAVSAPFSGRPCVGYAFLFCASDTYGGPILLAGGAHGGFVIRPGNGAGREVVAEPGSLRLEAERPGVPAPADAVARFVDRFHPSLRERLPFDSVIELCVVSGTPVEAHGKLVEAAFSYRSAGGQLRFTRVPQLAITG